MTTVASFSKDEGRKARPHGLNTVALLKVASATLNIGPQRAMAVAEGLYIQGYLSYPRTESSAYPPNFDFDEVLAEQARHPLWGAYARVSYPSLPPAPPEHTLPGTTPGRVTPTVSPHRVCVGRLQF